MYIIHTLMFSNKTIPRKLNQSTGRPILIVSCTHHTRSPFSEKQSALIVTRISETHVCLSIHALSRKDLAFQIAYFVSCSKVREPIFKQFQPFLPLSLLLP